MKLVLGIDTGGTYTDAVLLDAETGAVIASGKARTTRDDLSRGISDVMDSLPAGLLPQVGSLALSTTLATNACVEDKGGRAKLILIGAEQDAVAESGPKYGLPPADEIFFVDAAISFDGTRGNPAFLRGSGLPRRRLLPGNPQSDPRAEGEIPADGEVRPLHRLRP